MNVLLVAEESAGLRALKVLVTLGCDVVGVLTSDISGNAIRRAAHDVGVEAMDPARVKTPALADWIHDRGVDILLNVHSLHVAHRHVVEAPRLGSFNLHPGPLPRYAGLNAPSWAIYNGETEHGVTLHRMTAGIDRGAIVAQTIVPITNRDTGLTLSIKCIEAGIPLIERLIATALTPPGLIPSIPQDMADRSYYGSASPNDGWLDWGMPVRRIVDLIRASTYDPFPSPWGLPKTRWRGAPLHLVRAARRVDRTTASIPGTILTVGKDGVEVAAADGSVLLQRIRWNGSLQSPSSVLIAGEVLGRDG